MTGVDDQAAALLALASLPEMGPRRLAALVLDRSPGRAWARVREGRLQDLPELIEATRPGTAALFATWQRTAAGIDGAELLAAHRSAGIGVSWPGAPDYPGRFLDDPEPPLVLFHRGDLAALAGPRLGVVGTRRCTRYGSDVAFEIGFEAWRSGLRVVSGLALGIDAAAHAGAVEAARSVAETTASGFATAPPVAVVATGLDVPYPRQNRQLWHRVETEGVVLSEYPMGTTPRGWRFPARNRLLAALADVLVVVESGWRGGSLYTVDEAVARGRTVIAVPGPVTSPVSAGTNALLADRALPYLGFETIEIAFSLDTGARTRAPERRPRPEPADRRVLDALGWEPATLDHLALRCAREPGSLLASLDRLGEQGWVSERGGWWERIGRQGQ